MKRVRYTKYTGDLASEIDLEDLLQALSDYLLDSGFNDPYSQFESMDRTLDELREAIRQALESGDFLDDRTQESIDALSEQNKLEDLIDKLIERMMQENFISSEGSQSGGGSMAEGQG